MGKTDFNSGGCLFFLSIALLAGCGEPVSADSGGGDGETDTDTDTDIEGEAVGTCDGYTTGSPTVALDTLYSGTVTSEAWDDAVEARLFDTEDDWLAFLATFEVEGAVGTADFATHQVAVALVRVSSTCGLTVDGVAVTQATGEPVHVDITVTDSSGGCDTACSALGEAMAAVAVARDGEGDPTVCARRDDSC